MHKLLLDIPTRIETERLYLRSYQAGDGQWYYETSKKNKSHLARYEGDNAVMSINSEEDAEVVVRDYAACWVARKAFFLGAFDRVSDEFVAQIYVGPVNWDIPEFQIGFFADAEHEGQGYVTEAVKATLGFVFQHLKAERISLECDDTNTRSYRVAERCDMVREGHIRKNKRNVDGSISGTFHYGILRSEFSGREE
jgi:RimJ/RimL family protein N-acetyltransferase